jgi:transketolase
MTWMRLIKPSKQAKTDPRPSIIMCRTIIGYGAPNRQGTSKAHGEPLGDEELNAAKDNLGWEKEPRFFIPDDVLAFYRKAVDRGANSKPIGRCAAKPTSAFSPISARNSTAAC